MSDRDRLVNHMINKLVLTQKRYMIIRISKDLKIRNDRAYEIETSKDQTAKTAVRDISLCYLEPCVNLSPSNYI
jgi:hypothetical protein